MLISVYFRRVPSVPLSKNERLKHTIFTNHFKNKTVKNYETIHKRNRSQSPSSVPTR